MTPERKAELRADNARWGMPEIAELLDALDEAESRDARLREALVWALECVPQRLDWDNSYNEALAKARAALAG